MRQQTREQFVTAFIIAKVASDKFNPKVVLPSSINDATPYEKRYAEGYRRELRRFRKEANEAYDMCRDEFGWDDDK